MLLHYTGYPPIVLGLLLVAGSILGFKGRIGGAKRVLSISAFVAFISWIIYEVPFVVLDFSLKPVFENSSYGLAEYLRLAVAWSTGGGSLFLFTVFATISIYYVARREESKWFLGLAPIVPIVSLIVSYFYEAFEWREPVGGGLGFNPLLKSPWVYPHPLTTFGGYALLAIGGLGFLVGRNRRASFITFEVGWGLVTAGIVIGGYWSYETFGWGGYWAWDPVETAELMVWLIATLIPHLVVVAKRFEVAFSALLVSSVFLAMYVVRTGLSPLHGFASPNIGSYLLIGSTMVFLAVFVYLLARSMSEVGKSDVKRFFRSCRRLTILGMAIASLSLVIASFITYSTLLVPSFMAARGMEASVPQMEEGVRFYHPILYPLSLLLLVFSPIGFMGRDIGWRGFSAYVIATMLASAFVIISLYRGTLVLAPKTSFTTQAMMGVGIVVSSVAIGGLIFYVGRELYRFYRRGRLSIYAGIALIHLGFAVTMLGVYLGGTYSFNDEYFIEYTLRPGEAISLPGGAKLRLVAYEYDLVKRGVDIYTGYVGRATTYFYAWEALVTARNDLFDIINDYYRGGELVRENALLSLIYDLVDRNVTVSSISSKNISISIYGESITEKEKFTILENAKATVSLGNVTIIFGVRQAERGIEFSTIMTPGVFKIVLSDGEEISINDLRPSPHTVYRVYFKEPIIINRDNFSLAITNITVFLRQPPKGQELVVVEDSGIEFTSTWIIASGTLEVNKTNVELPMQLSEEVATYLVLKEIDNPFLRRIFESDIVSIARSGEIDNVLRVDECPSQIISLGDLELCMASFRAPVTVPETAILRLVFELEESDGDKNYLEALIRFEVNGEIQGIHGLVPKVLHSTMGVSDVYITVNPPTVSSKYTGFSYHELAIYYLTAASKEMKLSSLEKFVFASLLAAGLNIDFVRDKNPSERAFILEQSTVDLFILSEEYETSGSIISSGGVSVRVKIVPGTDLVWIGPLLMMFSSIAIAVSRSRE